MKNTFEINEKTYTAAPFTYNLICDLDDMGISIADASAKPNSFIRGYVAVCGKMSKEEAGAEIEKHLINGGKMEAVMEAMTKEMNASDFFRSLTESSAKKTSKSEK